MVPTSTGHRARLSRKSRCTSTPFCREREGVQHVTGTRTGQAGVQGGLELKHPISDIVCLVNIISFNAQ